MKYTPTIAVIACVAMLFSCAQRKTDNYNELERASLKAWMDKNVQTYETLDEGGVYIKKIVEGTGQAVENEKWMFYDITGTDLQGNVFYFRDSLEARIQGTYIAKTHYAPYLNAFTYPNYTIPEHALAIAFNTMKEGDSVAVYATSSFTYGSSSYPLTYSYVMSGYEGQYQTCFQGSVPAIFRIKLHKVIDNVQDYENQQVAGYAADNFGQTIADTISANMYRKIILPVTGKKEVTDTATGLKLYYVAKFLDGFVYDTNIDTVAKRLWGSNASYSAVVNYNAGSPAPGALGVYKAVLGMRYTEWATVAFNSDYGYGYTGQEVGATSTSYVTEIRPYTPLVYDIYVADWGDSNE